jgi:hypothetical protein
LWGQCMVTRLLIFFVDRHVFFTITRRSSDLRGPATINMVRVVFLNPHLDNCHPV